MSDAQMDDEDTKLLIDLGFIREVGERKYTWVKDSPKYIKCEHGHWNRTHKGGDYSLIFCPKCNVNYVMLYGDDDFIYKTLDLARKGRVCNDLPEE